MLSDVFIVCWVNANAIATVAIMLNNTNATTNIETINFFFARILFFPPLLNALFNFNNSISHSQMIFNCFLKFLNKKNSQMRVYKFKSFLFSFLTLFDLSFLTSSGL